MKKRGPKPKKPEEKCTARYPLALPEKQMETLHAYAIKRGWTTKELLLNGLKKFKDLKL